MIESTFCHLPGISLSDEKVLWRKGIRSWDDLLCWASVYCSDDRYNQYQKAVGDSQAAVECQHPEFFLQDLPASEWYRVYPDFTAHLHCLDIETSSMDEDAEITCISILSDGVMHSFVGADDLGSTAKELAGIRIVVTFNGTRFDLPRLTRRFSGFLPRFHIDLAVVLAKQGLRGSLKHVAARLGWTQDERDSEITNGAEAAGAWADYLESGDRTILARLRAYNQKDVEMLDFTLQALVRRHRRAAKS